MRHLCSMATPFELLPTVRQLQFAFSSNSSRAPSAISCTHQRTAINISLHQRQKNTQEPGFAFSEWFVSMESCKRERLAPAAWKVSLARVNVFGPTFTSVHRQSCNGQSCSKVVKREITGMHRLIAVRACSEAGQSRLFRRSLTEVQAQACGVVDLTRVTGLSVENDDHNGDPPRRSLRSRRHLGPVLHGACTRGRWRPATRFAGIALDAAVRRA